MKFDDTPSREEREDFWLDLGPASAYEGLDCCETARRDGDASPDGLAHGFEGAETPEDLVAPPDDDPDSEPVPHLPPQLKALEWLDKAYEDRNSWMPFLQGEPRLDPLRSDPRFQDLLRRMNLSN